MKNVDSERKKDVKMLTIMKDVSGISRALFTGCIALELYAVAAPGVNGR